MKYASIDKGDGTRVVQDTQTGKELSNSKLMARVFGYMGIGLAVTAVVAFLVGYLLLASVNTFHWLDAETAANVYLVLLVVSCIGLLVVGFLGNIFIIRSKKSAWPLYITYAVLMGILLSSFLILGVDFATIGAAAGITAVVFVALWAIGYFSKVDLNPFAYVGLALLFCLVLFGGFWAIIYFAVCGGNTQVWADGYYTYSLIVSFAFMALTLIVVAVDSYNIRKILARAGDNSNIVVYCAYALYCDFIVLFIRVLLLLASMKKD